MNSEAGDRERLAALVERWVGIDSVTGNEAAFLEELQGHLEGLGFCCERQPLEPGRWNLLARRPGQRPRLLYSTHVDTVPPFLPVRRDEEAVWGRGACDTKGGIVAMIEAGSRLVAQGHEALGYLFVVGEEVDHAGAKLAQKLGRLGCEQIVLCEPTCNQVVTAQKGMLRCTVRAEGRAAHSAYPERGESAVHKLVEALHRMLHREWPRDERLGTTDLNVGEVRGGVAANVMAPKAEATLLIRTVSENQRVVEELASCCAGEVTLEGIFGNDPVHFEVPPGEPTCTVRFNTDAAYLAPLGPIWLVGPGDIRLAHSVDEHIRISSLVEGVELYERLGQRVLG